jgi:hypothetical protein
MSRFFTFRRWHAGQARGARVLLRDWGVLASQVSSIDLTSHYGLESG